MLDFVPNHTGLDHPWVEDHPEYYIAGTELDLARAPQNYTWVKRKRGDLLLAYGRDPYFPGWPDTLQLNYGNPATQEAMIGELLKIAGQCDGVRCDMAMLVLPDVFERTWGIACAALLAEGDPARARARSRTSCFMAEVYWDLEWTLQQQGFDYAYDKRLYDRLRERPRPAGARALPRGPGLPGQAGPLPGEPRRAAGGGDVPAGRPRGRGGHHVPVAGPAVLPPGTVRGAKEAHLAAPRPRRRTNRSTRSWSSSTTGCSPCCASRSCATAGGNCSNALPPGTATGPGTASWRSPGKAPAASGCWSAVNYAPNQSQCYVRLPFADLGGRQWRLEDQLGDGRLRPGRRRPAVARPVPGHGAVAGLRLLAESRTSRKK